MKIRLLLLVFIIGLANYYQPASAQKSHSFKLSKSDFLLDGKPFQIISGEMHPARIPKQYWRHRIQMAKPWAATP